MADEKDNEILLTVKIDEEAVEKKIVSLRKEVIGLKNDKEELRKQFKANTISQEDYAKGLTKTNLAINQANKEIRENERTLEKNTQQQKAAAGSLVQMRANLSLLTADYAALSKEERKSADVGKVLQDRIKGLSDELKAEEGAIGDNRRSVGGYAEAIEQAISGNSSWIGSLRNTAGNLKEAKEGITQYVSGLKNTASGLDGAKKASFAFGLSLKALGIGLLLQAIAGLVAFLSKMDAGMDKVEQATAAVSAGFEALIQTIAPIGEAIVNAFLHPIDTLKSFAEALRHPLDSFDKLVNGSKKFSEDLANNIGKAARAAVEYTKTQQNLEDAQDGLILKQAEANAAVGKALIAAKDRSKTERERIKLLDDAGAKERQVAKEILKIRQDDLASLIKLQASKKELQDEDRKKLLEVKAAAVNAQAESEETEQKIQNRRAALIEQEASAREAAANKAKEAAKKRADESVAESERALILAKRRGEETLSIEEEIIRRRLKSEVIGLGKLSQQRKLLEAKAAADILEVNSKAIQEAADKTFDLAQTQTNRQIALARRGSQAEFDAQKKQLEDQLVRDRVTANETIKSRKLLRQRLLELDAQNGVATEQLEDAFNKGVLDRQADLNQKRLQTEIDLGQQTLKVQLDNQRKQINQEEAQALALLDLEEETARKRALLDAQLQEELLVKRNAIQAKAIAARRELDKQQAERERADATALTEARLFAVKEGSKAELEIRKDLLRKQRDAELANTKTTEAEKEKIRAQYKKQEEDLDEEFGKSTVERIVQTASAASSTLSAIYEAQSQRAFAELDKQQAAALKSAGTNADLRSRIEDQYQKKREALEKTAAEKRRRIASIENKIQTAQAATAALELFAKNPVLGAITELLILTKAVANQRLIDSQAFAEGTAVGYRSDGRGAYVRGPGTGTSDSIMARISNGESVLTAKATSMFYDQLSAINVAGGGRAFPGAGLVDVPEPTAFALGGLPQSNGGNLQDVVSAIQGLNIFVSVAEFEQVQSDMVKAKATGNY